MDSKIFKNLHVHPVLSGIWIASLVVSLCCLLTGIGLNGKLGDYMVEKSFTVKALDTSSRLEKAGKASARINVYGIYETEFGTKIYRMLSPVAEYEFKPGENYKVVSTLSEINPDPKKDKVRNTEGFLFLLSAFSGLFFLIFFVGANGLD